MRTIYVLDQGAERKDDAPDGVYVATSVDEFLDDLRTSQYGDMAAIVSYDGGLWIFWADCDAPFIGAAQFDYLMDGVKYTYCRRVSSLNAVRDVVHVLVDVATP